MLDFEVLMAVIMKGAILRDVTPCSSIEVYLHFRVTYCLDRGLPTFQGNLLPLASGSKSKPNKKQAGRRVVATGLHGT
jgi:hypothetical protein